MPTIDRQKIYAEFLAQWCNAGKPNVVDTADIPDDSRMDKFCAEMDTYCAQFTSATDRVDASFVILQHLDEPIRRKWDKRALTLITNPPTALGQAADNQQKTTTEIWRETSAQYEFARNLFLSVALTYHDQARKFQQAARTDSLLLREYWRVLDQHKKPVQPK